MKYYVLRSILCNIAKVKPFYIFQFLGDTHFLAISGNRHYNFNKLKGELCLIDLCFLKLHNLIVI